MNNSKIIKNEKGVVKIIQIEEFQDYEWANDWKAIVEIFNVIDRLKELFNI